MHKQISRHLDAIAAARRRVLTDADPESLHDLRIALRALRAVLPILSRKPDLAELRARWQSLARTTGGARDSEVMLELLNSLQAPSGQIRDILQQQTHKFRAQLIQQLSTAEMPLLLQYTRNKLGSLTEHPPALRHNSLQRAARLYRKIMIQIAALNPESEPEAWHTLRLEVKRLRYLIEYCARWLPSDWASLLSPLKNCQSRLGDLHDIDLLIVLTAMPLEQERQIRQSAAAQAVSILDEVMKNKQLNRANSRTAN